MGGNAGHPDARRRGPRACDQPADRIEHGPRVRPRDPTIALANGLSLGVADWRSVSRLFFHNPLLGAVIGAAMVINNLAAGLGGILVPVTLDRLGIDPAVSSAVFVTTITDVMGFFSFLGLAALSAWSAKQLQILAASSPPHSQAVPKLHLTKVAFGCRDLDALRATDRQRALVRRDAGRHPHAAQARGRADRRQSLLDRQAPAGRRGVEILRFEDRQDGRIDIVCSAELELPSRRCRKRAHQGWRYLEDADAPGDG